MMILITQNFVIKILIYYLYYITIFFNIFISNIYIVLLLSVKIKVTN